MKSILLSFFFIALVLPSLAAANLVGFFSDANQFFKTHVAQGLVDYASIQQAPADLQELLTQIAGQDLSSANAPHRCGYSWQQ
jgi:hypothetical protein